MNITEENSWRTTLFRIHIVRKIEEEILKSGISTNKTSMEMENHLYQRANTKDEYLYYVARLILHLGEMGSNRRDQMEAAGGPIFQDNLVNEPSEE
ncbi:mediator of RNA polymerase II transcription subunit 15-like [Planococcus citri]|uniref:mediator of RNA polymerase II transcription subunit 15-like n=1 Tax=Planococcus citri TaxID=170843 RepID=UPI0031FA473E